MSENQGTSRDKHQTIIDCERINIEAGDDSDMDRVVEDEEEHPDNVDAQENQIAIDEAMHDQANEANNLWGDAPILGMTFESVDEAYDFYNAYGRYKGFSIRINNTSHSRKEGNAILMRRFCCSKEGKQRTSLQFNSPKKPRPVSRVGCGACFVVRLQSNKKYKLTDFVEEHNHVLAKPTEVHILRSQRLVNNLHRWTRDATSGVIMNSSADLNEPETGVQVDPKPSLSSRYSKLTHVALAFAVKASTTDESFELGMKELMEGLRKVDICLETHGGKINKKVTEVNEEPTEIVKNPPRKKAKDASYGRRKGGKAAQQVIPDTSQVQGAHNPYFDDSGSMPIIHPHDPNISQPLFPQNYPIQNANSSDYIHYRNMPTNMSMIAKQGNPHSSLVQDAYKSTEVKTEECPKLLLQAKLPILASMETQQA